MLGQVLAPGGYLNARQNDLLIALFRQPAGLLRRLLHRQRAHPAPGVGDDAVRAEIGAAVLDLQHSPGSALQPSGGQLFKPPALERVIQGGKGLPLPNCALQKLHKAGAVAGAADQVHPQLFHISRVCLGITAAHRDHRVRSRLSGPADDLPGLLIAHGGDGAGVDQIGVRVPLEGDDLMSPGGKQLLQRLGLILVHLTAQGVKRYSHFPHSGTTANTRSSSLPSLIRLCSCPSGQ